MMDGKAIRQKLIGNEQERAVSPVIGVILMVAITVILAAVIAAFVLDMGPGDDSVQAGVQVSGEGTTSVSLEVTDSGNADGLVAVDPSSGDVQGYQDGITTGETVTMGSGEDIDVSGGATYTVYAIKSDDVTAVSNLDEADGNIQVAEVEVGS